MSVLRWVFDLADGSAEKRGLLGNKGANLAEMIHVLGPEVVPGGFTVTTEACVEYMHSGTAPPGLDAEVDAALATLERSSGLRFGDPENPLLVSVRSGAPVSMPGMLDTILNLGLTDVAVEGLAKRSGNPHFAWDSRRRLVQMFAQVVRGAPADAFEEELAASRHSHHVDFDHELDETALRSLVGRFLEIYADHTGEAFPEDPRVQLRQAIIAVFDSWNNERAATYRHLNGIPAELGTAVTVQRMVFGNLGEHSGSGVAFTRDPTTGEPGADGDFLLDAQGEDVVAGVRNTETLEDLKRRMPEMHRALLNALTALERHYRDIQDVEYTIEDGRLYILQTRNAKRHASASVRFAVDGRKEGMFTREKALLKIDPASLVALMHPAFDPSIEIHELTRGVPASPGAAKGAIVFSASEAVERAAAGEEVILVRPFTSADDVGGFHAAQGILTSRGGKSSHAAIVARGMGRPCVCGASDVAIDVDARTMRIGATELHGGDRIAIDGASGVVTADDVPLIEPQLDDAFLEVLAWADDFRHLGVLANADTAEDAARARELGAEGIGLCRTEHMFFGPDREELVREMFIAGELARRERATAGGGNEHRGDYERALEQLAELQRADFVALIHAMEGMPVTIRLLDPPMHEFIGPAVFETALAAAEASGDAGAASRARERIAIARDLEEVNPMLGTRGARLGLHLGGLYEMQVRAIAEAALEVAAGGELPEVEVMIPLIAFPNELIVVRAAIERSITEALGGGRLAIGTMIELPAACLAAGELADHADFFSFGTNDLTQTALGLSRDDAERGFLPGYLERGIVERSPFETIDVTAVGGLVDIAVERGLAAKPELKLGVCGEHGGDPASIAFFHDAGLDYVSCSPFRVPIARVAAAQAAIRSPRRRTDVQVVDDLDRELIEEGGQPLLRQPT